MIKQATQLAGAGHPVQMNLSARSVGDPDVLEHIERCMQQWEVAPGLIVVEITETAIVEDQQAARAFAEGLHSLGCEIALDDFGTGYGTFTYLKQIPVDYLKLDIEFVRDLASSSASRHVVHAVLTLARNFNLQDGRRGSRGRSHPGPPVRPRGGLRPGLPHRASRALRLTPGRPA